MSNRFGMPGPGGSLGECALCGCPFAFEIMLGKTVQSFRVGGCEQELFGHDKCLKEFDGKTMLDLPEASALRRAYERQQADEPRTVEIPK